MTSARVATLRVAPDVLQAQGCLTPQLLHAECRRAGYSVHLCAFYRVLPDLAAAGLLPLHTLRLPASRMTKLFAALHERGQEMARS